MNITNVANVIASSAGACIPKSVRKAGTIAGHTVYDNMPSALQKMTDYYISKSLGSNEKLSPKESSERIVKQILAGLPCCDPLFLVTTLGTIKLISQKKSLKNQSSIGIKVSICKETSTVDINESTPLQGIMRWIQGDSRNQLCYIYSHLSKALEWFPPNNPAHFALYQACLDGLKVLLKTYDLEKEGSFILTQKEKGSHSNPPIQVDIYQQDLTTELGLAKAVLTSNIDLLEKIIEQNNYPSGAHEKSLPSEGTQGKLNPLYQYAEKFLEDELKKLWTPTTISGIANIFNTPSSCAKNARDSIDALIKNFPSLYCKLLKNLESELIKMCSNFSVEEQSKYLPH